jgi:hypothetical protein
MSVPTTTTLVPGTSAQFTDAATGTHWPA